MLALNLKLTTFGLQDYDNIIAFIYSYINQIKFQAVNFVRY